MPNAERLFARLQAVWRCPDDRTLIVYYAILMALSWRCPDDRVQIVEDAEAVGSKGGKQAAGAVIVIRL